MNSLCRWVSMIWLPASVVFAQGPAAETPRLDLAKAAVTVVFAPDYARASPQPRQSLRSLETSPSRIVSAMTGRRGSPAPDPIGFAALKGLTGIRTGAESVMATVVTVGDSGRLQFSCSSLPQALERLKAAGKDAANDR